MVPVSQPKQVEATKDFAESIVEFFALENAQVGIHDERSDAKRHYASFESYDDGPVYVVGQTFVDAILYALDARDAILARREAQAVAA